MKSKEFYIRMPIFYLVFHHFKKNDVFASILKNVSCVHNFPDSYY